jgi:hypothetical protein
MIDATQVHIEWSDATRIAKLRHIPTGVEIAPDVEDVPQGRDVLFQELADAVKDAGWTRNDDGWVKADADPQPEA